MRNKSKITTLESKFPLLSVEQGCMVSKDADITVGFPCGAARTLYRHFYRIRSNALCLAQGYKSATQLQHRTQAGLVYQGGLSRKLSDGGLSSLPVPLNGTLMNVPISTTRSISSLPRPTSSVWHSRAIFLRSAVDTSFPRKSPTRTK